MVDEIYHVNTRSVPNPDTLAVPLFVWPGLHQGKNEAFMLYFFIAHIYDNFLNPWHWTDEMRTASLTSGSFDLGPNLTVADVGAGTGFTTIGVLQQGVLPSNVMMLDQSPQQLSKARAKQELQGLAAIIEGDAENLPSNWTGNRRRAGGIFILFCTTQSNPICDSMHSPPLSLSSITPLRCGGDGRAHGVRHSTDSKLWQSSDGHARRPLRSVCVCRVDRVLATPTACD
jgi:SAM-dependent methyltransferase